MCASTLVIIRPVGWKTDLLWHQHVISRRSDTAKLYNKIYVIHNGVLLTRDEQTDIQLHIMHFQRKSRPPCSSSCFFSLLNRLYSCSLLGRLLLSWVHTYLKMLLILAIFFLHWIGKRNWKSLGINTKLLLTQLKIIKCLFFGVL